MSTSRRAFLKSAAAVPVAAAAVVIPSAAPAAVESIAPAAVRTAAPYPFTWWFSSDGGESYCEECDTREQILRVAKDYGGGLIAECRRQDFDLGLSGDDIIESLYGQNEEIIGEGDFLQCTKEQSKELGDMVSDAIVAWVDKYNIDTAAWTFGETRNHTEIQEPAPSFGDRT